MASSLVACEVTFSGRTRKTGTAGHPSAGIHAGTVHVHHLFSMEQSTLSPANPGETETQQPGMPPLPLLALPSGS